ncbi:ImmA/IrrE family metallo-endopeptidase, partial [Intestinimonas sp. HCP28S3_D6]|uniref:ImmA/IrrE family metallo-endopeptidase n=1 Tax=Intestinimonas sp. HCP28S3_D6 TaxID=3438942 RepID=UPI003F8AD310
AGIFFRCAFLSCHNKTSTVVLLLYTTLEVYTKCGMVSKTTPIHEFMLYDMKSKPEYEANIVAAEILMDSDEVLRYIYEYGYTAEQIASAMSTDINLVALKVAHLATLGYNLHALEHKSNFLK